MQWFTGFELGFDVPDETTLCRFRNRLVDAGLDQVLFTEINRQLEKAGLKVEASKGAIVDATIIPSAARPRKELELDEADEPHISDSADPDARWVKKGNKAFFGYRTYHIVDVEDGMVHHSETHPANETETKKLPLYSMLFRTIVSRYWQTRVLPARPTERIWQNEG